jgi:PST family polysaccharide transporter
MDLIKTSVLTSLSTAVRIAAAFVINKVIALYIGPSGLALTGQFMNFVSIVLGFSNGGINSGIVKYVAEYREHPEKRAKILSTSLAMSLLCSLALTVFILAFHRSLALHLLKSTEYKSIFIIFGITLVIFSVNSSLVSTLNGYKEIKKFVALNITASIIGLIITSVLVCLFKLYGSLLAIVVSQTLIFFVTILFTTRSEWFKLSNFTRGIDRASLLNLSKFSLMALVSAATVPTAQIIIRNYIADHISMDAAGYWQGVWKISEVYLLVVTTSLSVYYLPRLSELLGKEVLRKEIFSGYKILLPVVLAMAIMIYLLREFIVIILFTREFMPMADLFTFQLTGDVLKIASWLLSFLMVAKAMTKLYVITELCFISSFVIFSIVFLNRFGLVGVTYAYALNYLLYLFTMIYLFRGLVFKGDVTRSAA